MARTSLNYEQLNRLLSSSALTFGAPKNEIGLPVYSFSDIEFSEEITLYQINEANSRIEFINCTFLGAVNFRISDCNVQLFFSKCIFEKDVNFEKGNYPHYIGFSESTFLSKLEFAGGAYALVALVSLNARNLTVKGGEFGNLQVSKIHPAVYFIKELNLFSGFSGQLSFQGITAFCVLIDGIIGKDADVLFSDIKTFFFNIFNVDVKGKIRLTKIKQIRYDELKYVLENDKEEGKYVELFKYHSTFQICRSYLANTEFQNIAFENFSSLIIAESFIEDCVFSNVTWPADIKSNSKILYDDSINHLYTAGSRNSFELERDVYRQLKSAMKSQHDVIGSQFFYGKEMMSYYKSIHFIEQPGTKTIIWLSFVSSNFGQSLRRPLLCMLLLNGFFYFLLVYFNYIGYPESIGSLFGSFLFYNNPLHKAPDNWTSWNYVIDVSMRIVSSYAIYNFIRASRRFLT